MEQERHQIEAEETEFQIPSIPILCANNCGFFGSSATNNMCSKCFKTSSLSKSKAPIENSIAKTAVEVDGTVDSDDRGIEVGRLREEGNPSVNFPAKKPANRCSFCNKRVGLMGFKCRCENVYCSLHRYSDKHGCLFDYRGAGQDVIAKENPVVKADKVEKI